jgi:hypothetical protein
MDKKETVIVHGDVAPKKVVDAPENAGKPMIVYVYSALCPHCTTTNETLGKLQAGDRDLSIHKFAMITGQKRDADGKYQPIFAPNVTGAFFAYPGSDLVNPLKDPNGKPAEISGFPAFMLISPKGEVIAQREGAITSKADYREMQDTFAKALTAEKAKAAAKEVGSGLGSCKAGGNAPETKDVLAAITVPNVKSTAGCGVAK